MDLIKETHLSPKLIAEIRHLHFHTRRLATETLAGSYRSAFRGQGIEFEEVREYYPGDDVRNIDWKVTARSGKPFIKSYREERELEVVIAVDVSASTFSATRGQLRSRTLAQVGAVLSLVALHNNDKVGLVTYSDRLETYHPPRKSRSAVWRILHEVLNPGVYSPGTDLPGMFSFLARVMRRNSIVFLLSDFFGPSVEEDLRKLARRVDVTAVRVFDPADIELPRSGWLRVLDPESGTICDLDTSSEAVRRTYHEEALRVYNSFPEICSRLGLGFINVPTHESLFEPLRSYFLSRQFRRMR